MEINETGQELYRILAPGKVYFNHGPSSIVVMADRAGEPLTELCCQAYAIIDATLEEIANSLPKLRSYPSNLTEDIINRSDNLPRKMMQAVLAIAEPTLTPMATVAGQVSDAVADWLYAQGADRVIVNNGGDIAIRLTAGSFVKVGIVDALESGNIVRTVKIFTRGIAKAVTAFAKNCTLADALATHLANCSYVVSPRVTTAKAGSIDPNSDIKDLDIVAYVGELAEKEVEQALTQVQQEISRQVQKQNLIGAYVNVQNQSYDFGLPINE